MERSNRIIAMTTALLLTVPAAWAQFSIDARLSGALDSLGYPDDARQSYAFAAGALHAKYLFADQRARLFYSLDAATHSTPGDWTTFFHDAGGSYRFDLSESDEARLFVGAAARWRDNGDAWAAAGYRSISGWANAQLRPRAGTSFRFGYRIDARDFPDMPALDQLEHDLFANANLNFQTRTSLIGEVHLGAKSYDGELLLVDTMLDGAEGSRGSGRGNVGPSLRPARFSATDSGERAQRVAWLVRIAQSLGEHTGMSLQYGMRHSFGEVPPALISTPARFFDDGVYDDPYASDALSLSGTFKHVFVGGAVARAWGTWQSEDYRGTPALDASGEARIDGALREDRIWRAGAELSVPLFPEHTGPTALDVALGYDFTRQLTNDAFYDYSSHAVGLTLMFTY